MAATESFELWKTNMPVFAEMTRLEYFRDEIRAGRKQYKDFYVYFKNHLIAKFDQEVSDSSARTSRFLEEERGAGRSLQLKFWQQLPWDIRLKTYLTLHGVEIETKLNPDLSEREVNILRWAALMLHIGCSKRSKTSKTHIYSFLSALYMIQMLESRDIAPELLDGADYTEMQIVSPRDPTKTLLKSKGVDLQIEDKPPKCRDQRLQITSELINNSKQPLKPGIFVHNDRLFMEKDKPIASMPSHHNLNTIFAILTDSSKRVFHEINARKTTNDKGSLTQS